MNTRHIIQLITLPAKSVVMSAADYEDLEALLNTNKQLEQELRLAEEGLASYAQENEQLCGELSLAKRALEDLAQANERVRLALVKYGGHKEECACMGVTGESLYNNRCDCGLHALLHPPQEAPE